MTIVAYLDDQAPMEHLGVDDYGAPENPAHLGRARMLIEQRLGELVKGVYWDQVDGVVLAPLGAPRMADSEVDRLVSECAEEAVREVDAEHAAAQSRRDGLLAAAGEAMLNAAEAEARRDLAIVAAQQAGHSLRTIADQGPLSHEAVRKIINRHNARHGLSASAS
jgi:hypothetical protein